MAETAYVLPGACHGSGRDPLLKQLRTKPKGASSPRQLNPEASLINCQ